MLYAAAGPLPANMALKIYTTSAAAAQTCVVQQQQQQRGGRPCTALPAQDEYVNMTPMCR